jgi:hypothetical protein
MSMSFRLKRILAGTGDKLFGPKNSRTCSESESFPLSRVIGNCIRLSSRPLAVVLSTGTILVLSAALITPTNTQADNDDETTTVSVDVRQVGTTNAQNNVDPSKPFTSFDRGDTFILGGDIYPSGTIQRVPAGLKASDPTVPPIGKYIMRGTYTGTPDTTPIVAFSSELFLLPDEGTTLLTDGLWPNEQFAARRQVLGGTGRFRYVVGEAHEENIGLNKDEFCNLHVTFRLRKVSGRHDR